MNERVIKVKMAIGQCGIAIKYAVSIADHQPETKVGNAILSLWLWAMMMIWHFSTIACNKFNKILDCIVARNDENSSELFYHSRDINRL